MKTIKSFLTFLFSVLLICFLLFLSLIINISSFFKIDSMENAVKNIDFIHEIEKIQNSSATSEEKSEIADIINMAYEEADRHGISSDLVDEIFDSTEVKVFLGRIIGSTTDSLINNTDNKKITSDDFNKLLDDNIDEWIKNSNVSISDSKKEVLLIRMKSVGAGIIDNLPDSSFIYDKAGANKIKMIQFLFSNVIKIGLVVLCLVCMFLLVLLNRYNSVLYIGISLMVTGVLLVGISLLLTDILTNLLANYNLSFIISAFKGSLSIFVLLTGIVEFVIGLILLIIRNMQIKKENLV